MGLPDVKVSKKSRSICVSGFGGIDTRCCAGEESLRWCENISHDAAPGLRARAARKTELTLNSPTSLFSWDRGLVVCDGNSVLYNGDVIGTVTAGEKQFAVVGAKLCIFPDKVYVDLTNGEFKPLAPSVALGGEACRFTENSIVADRIDYVGEFINYTNALEMWGIANEPLPYVMTYESVLWDSSLQEWTKTGAVEKKISELQVGDIFIPFRISSSTKPWAIGINYGAGQPHEENNEGYYARWKDFVATAVFDGAGNPWGTNFYDMKFDLYRSAGTNADFREYFAPGDAVTVKGCAAFPENNAEKAVLLDVQEKTLVFDRVFTPAEAESALVTLTREVPDLDFVCQCGDRLCGVSNAAENTVYDRASGSFVTLPQRAVYLSAPGRPERFWDRAESISVAVASKDDFTGCAAYSGDALFFKEAEMHRLAGLGSANPTLYAYDVAGVQAGSHKSLCVVNEVLYYKGCHGVYAYSGATPKLISAPLGQLRFSRAAAGTDGLRYYISMADGDGNFSLMVYDSERETWLREDALEVKSFTRMGETLYMLSGNRVFSAGGVGAADDVHWEMEFPRWSEEPFSFKNYRRVFLRCFIGENARAEALLAESGGEPRPVWSCAEPGEHTISLPVGSNRCRSMSLTLRGVGDFTLCSLGREFFTGSEV